MFGASLCLAISSGSTVACSVDSVVSVPQRSSSDRSIVSFSWMLWYLRCLSCRELFNLVRDALPLLRNSRFHLDLIHDLAGEHLGVILQFKGVVPRVREDVVFVGQTWLTLSAGDLKKYQ